MSFKREGDDGSWLRSLQKRRVSELLAEEIPEGEAHLMKNGKFACLVCSHRPVFDTVNMLSIHRSGKKHMASIEYKKKEDEELAQLRELYYTDKRHDRLSAKGMKRSHTAYKSSGLSLLGSKPYDPRVKRRPDQRRPILELTKKDVPSTSADSDIVSLTVGRQDFESCEPSQTISEYKKRKRFISEQKCLDLKPYQRKMGLSFSESGNTVGQTQAKAKQNYVQDVVGQISGNKITLDEAFKRQDYQCVVSKQKTKKRTKVNKCTSMNSPDIDQKKAALREKYLQAIASGWKKDCGGCWVKDGDAEFDSDEEPPDLL